MIQYNKTFIMEYKALGRPHHPAEPAVSLSWGVGARVPLPDPFRSLSGRVKVPRLSKVIDSRPALERFSASGSRQRDAAGFHAVTRPSSSASSWPSIAAVSRQRAAPRFSRMWAASAERGSTPKPF